MSLTVGVLAVQGAVSEHVDALRRAADAQGMDVKIITVRTPADLARVRGLILPGGESTTISRLLRSAGIQAPLLERARAGDLALYGTCAGMVLLSSRATHDVAEKDIQLLGLLEAEVDRNAYGRQRESFETTADVEGVGTVPTVYIRAPVLTEVWGDTEVLARDRKGIVVARRGRVLASAFHPELTGDVRMHQAFLRMCVGDADEAA